MNESMRPAARPDVGPAAALRGARAAAVTLLAILFVSLIPLAYGTLTAVLQAEPGLLFLYLIFLLLPLNLGLVGAVLTVRRPENWIGWLLLVAGVLAGVAFACGEYERSVIATGAFDAPLFVLAAWIASWTFIPAIGLLVVFLPLLYPSGNLPSPRWRLLVAVGIVGVSVGALGSAVAPGPLADARGPLNPFVPPEPLLTWILTAWTVGNFVAPPVFLLSLASLLLRFRGSTGVERQQIKWFLFVASIAAVAFGVSIFNIGPISDAGWVLGILAMGFLPLAIGLAILRYRLYEIDRIVNRALVYGALTAILAGVFAAATALSQRLFIAVAGQSSDAAIVLTTLVVVAIYAPVRKRVEAVVDRYFKYDQREFGPYVDELRRLLDLVEPRRAAARLAREALRQTGATGVAVTGADGGIIASAGSWPAEPSVPIPIVPLGSALAAVNVGPRRDGKPHPPARLRALAEAATIAVAALYAGGFGPDATPADVEPARSELASAAAAADDLLEAPDLGIDASQS